MFPNPFILLYPFQTCLSFPPRLSFLPLFILYPFQLYLSFLPPLSFFTPFQTCSSLLFPFILFSSIILQFVFFLLLKFPICSTLRYKTKDSKIFQFNWIYLKLDYSEKFNIISRFASFAQRNWRHFANIVEQYIYKWRQRFLEYVGSFGEVFV